MLLAAIGTFLLLLIVLYLIVAPLARGEPADPERDASALLARKERLLSDIRDLDMDLATGKIEEQDHRRLRAALLADAAQILRALEEAGIDASGEEPAAAVSGEAAVGPRDAEPLADEARLEALIAARKREIASSACPSCGAPSAPGHASCGRCGTELAGRGAG